MSSNPALYRELQIPALKFRDVPTVVGVRCENEGEGDKTCVVSICFELACGSDSVNEMVVANCLAGEAPEQTTKRCLGE